MRRITIGVPYPGETRQKCGLVIGARVAPEWSIEVKMLRLMGDNGNRTTTC
jgi:hypothetical protein